MFRAAEVDGENDVAVILCSSGTSGLSKGLLKKNKTLNFNSNILYVFFSGVSLSHAVLVRLMAADFSADNVIFSFSSLYWLSGLIMLLVGTLFGAKRIITTESYSPELFLSILENFKVNAFVLIKTDHFWISLKKNNFFKGHICFSVSIPNSFSNKMQKYNLH